METGGVARLQVRICRRTGPISERIPHVRSEPNHSIDQFTRRLSWRLLISCIRYHQQSSSGLSELPHERRTSFQGESKSDWTYPEIRFLQLHRLSGPSPQTTHTLGIHHVSLDPTTSVEF